MRCGNDLSLNHILKEFTLSFVTAALLSYAQHIQINTHRSNNDRKYPPEHDQGSGSLDVGRMRTCEQILHVHFCDVKA